MNVLHLIDTVGPGGAETVLASIVNNLDPAQWRSRVLVRGPGWLTERLKDVDHRVVRSETSADVRYLRSLIKELREFKPDLIHAHLLTSGVYGSLAASISTQAPVVLTFHGRPDVNPEGLALTVKARIVSRSANRVVYVSEDLRSHLETSVGIPTYLGRTILNGVPFEPVASSGAEREGCGLAPDAQFVLAVGNIRKPKDYPTLVRAAAVVCSRLPQVHFVIAGDDEQEADTTHIVRQLISDLNLDERVTLLGFRRDASSLIGACDLFVSSSTHEGLPLATTEALGRGKPSVLTRVGGVPELVGNAQNAILVPSRSPNALAHGIIEILSSPARMREMGARAKADISTRFGQDRMIAAYVALYREVVSAQRV